MCVISMVHDHYDKVIPWIQPYGPVYPSPTAPFVPGTTEPDVDLGKLLSDYAMAMAAAKVVDAAIKQSDCEDPEKAKLTERVGELEALLASGVQFVLVKGAQLEPGRYRVVDGKLYREAAE